MMTSKTSHEFFEAAKQLLPGGVDSPVRSFASVGGEPFFVVRGHGAKIYDVDGREYIDYVCSYGPLILGHAPPSIVNALKEQAEHGTSYGAPTPLEVELAKLITEAMPSIEMVRFVNSGTEAAMSAIRLARGFTDRKKIVKCEGCYHGHGDSFLSKAGSGLATLGISASPGVPDEFAGLTLNVPYNDLDALERTLEAHAGEVAAFILEPVAANMGVVLPRDGYLQGVRELTRKHDVLLIFDEVITGFRLTYGGAQAVYSVSADLTILGKIIGGGLPVGAYGGRRDIMQMIAPVGPVYQAGTLSGNPLAMRAGIEMLHALQEPGFYAELEERAATLTEGFRQSARQQGWSIQVNHIGSMLTSFFTTTLVVDYQTAKSSNVQKYAQYFHRLLDQGIFIAPAQFEAMFVSSAHSNQDVEATLQAHVTAAKAIF
ncbi:MAG: glutamate-1-semialdehyde 2,1-aminomutase [Acidobacteria bacterium]|nr:glutamate-1-semialdehyde 2,1-aminomutase [Acidobacteriota bacterium]